jgi:hypothetical protein
MFPDVSGSIIRGNKSNVPDLAQWFQDPDGVKEAVDISYFNLPTLPDPQLTINNPVDYSASNNSTERITMTGRSNWNAGYCIDFKNSSTLLGTMALLWADLDSNFKYPNWAQADVKGAECALYLCIKEFETKIINGQLTKSSKEVDWTRDRNSYQIVSGKPDNSSMNENLRDPDLDELTRTDLQLVASGKRFAISQAGVAGLIDYINKAFDDGTLWFTGPSRDQKSIQRKQVVAGISGMVRLLPGTHDLQFTPDVMEVFWNQRGMQSLSALFDNLAASITNNIRITADGGTSLLGKSGKNEPIFVINMWWIAPTLAAQMAAMLFLWLTAWNTRRSRTPLWKGSVSSVLFHGLSARLKQLGISQILQSDMGELTKRIEVQLEEMDGGICLRKTSFITSR